MSLPSDAFTIDKRFHFEASHLPPGAPPQHKAARRLRCQTQSGTGRQGHRGERDELSGGDDTGTLS